MTDISQFSGLREDLLPKQLVDVLSTCPSRAMEQCEVEEDCEVDNIHDMMFEEDDEDDGE